MGQDSVIAFGEFRLNLKAQCLRRGDDEVRLRQKAWDVLVYLAQRPGVVVSNRELMDALWADVAVTPGVLNNIVWELRKAFGGKESSAPYLQTVPKRGLRFTPSVAEAAAAELESAELPVPLPTDRPLARDHEISELLDAWRRARSGRRQMIFVSGMPGVGKTTTVNAALQEIGAASSNDELLVTRGQCLRLQGEAEPYLPILEALEQVLATIGEARFTHLARRYAPSWLVQLPWLVSDEELLELRRALAASGTQRVLQDAVRLFERLSEEVPVTLVLEDTQWADAATLDFLAALAQRTTAARLMVIATYRPIEVSLTGHPVGTVARSLCGQARGFMLQLDSWPRAILEQYLDARFADPGITVALAAPLERHTRGNPLFVIETVDYLVEHSYLKASNHGWTIAAHLDLDKLQLPNSVAQIVHAWLAHQPTTIVDALEAASLIDGPFTVQEVAVALGRYEREVDADFTTLARHHRLIEAVGIGRWPDETITSAYTFSHALYQRAIADRVAPLRRQAFHRSIALRLEAAFRLAPAKAAPRLALHFEAAGDEPKHADYLEIAAASAMGRYAYAEGAAYVRRAIRSLERQPASASNVRRRVERWLDYGNAVHRLTGLGNPEAGQAFDVAGHLAREIGEERLSFRAQLGHAFNHFFSGKPKQAKAASLELLEIAAATNHGWLPAAHFYLAMGEIALGEFESACERMCAAFAMDAEPGIPASFNLTPALRYTIALSLALLGRVAELEELVATMMQPSRETAPRNEQMELCVQVAFVLALAGSWPEALALSTEGVRVADELQFTPYHDFAAIVRARACAAAAQGGRIDVAEIEARMRSREQRGDCWLNSCFFNWLAEGYQQCGELDAARAATDRSLALEERAFRSETWRIRGMVLDARGDGAEAEECMRKAWKVAQEQKAQGFQLRAAVALSRLLKRQACASEAQQLLSQALSECPDARGSQDFRAANAELQLD